jgi:hypothetical protein
MSLTVLPIISFGSGGSDTAASGAGPATALAGTVGAVTSASATATIGDAVDLSGVAVDGSAVLWIQTASGRQFSRISAISGSSGAWSLTLEDTVWTTSTAKTWGIGGKRATFANTDSRKLFSADVKPGWTVTTDADQSIATPLACSVTGNVTAGVVTVKGTTDAPRPKITQTANAVLITQSQLFWRWESLAFVCSSGTRTNAVGIDIQGGTGTLTLYNCDLGDATNKLQVGVQRGAGNARFYLIDSAIHDCVSHGINEVTGTSDGWLECYGGRVQANGGIGIQNRNAPSGIRVLDSIFSGNGNEAIVFGGVATGPAAIVGNTIHGNGTAGTFSGVRTADATCAAQAVICNNNITGNTQYGISLPAGSNAWKLFLDYNNFGTGTTANTSGAVSGVTAGAHDLTVDPGYTDAANKDFSVGAGVKAEGFPDATRKVGGNPATGTTSYVDIGAAQRQEPAGGGGVLVSTWLQAGRRGACY